ncbi:MAG: hypothetical protein KDB07_08015, partial [Planctomycetes bacterium]|nr:hypothetical protein [Planctomycetota bacterium]
NNVLKMLCAALAALAITSLSGCKNFEPSSRDVANHRSVEQFVGFDHQKEGFEPLYYEHGREYRTVVGLSEMSFRREGANDRSLSAYSQKLERLYASYAELSSQFRNSSSVGQGRTKSEIIEAYADAATSVYRLIEYLSRIPVGTPEPKWKGIPLEHLNDEEARALMLSREFVSRPLSSEVPYLRWKHADHFVGLSELIRRAVVDIDPAGECDASVAKVASARAQYALQIASNVWIGSEIGFIPWEANQIAASIENDIVGEAGEWEELLGLSTACHAARSLAGVPETPFDAEIRGIAPDTPSPRDIVKIVETDSTPEMQATHQFNVAVTVLASICYSILREYEKSDLGSDTFDVMEYELKVAIQEVCAWGYDRDNYNKWDEDSLSTRSEAIRREWMAEFISRNLKECVSFLHQCAPEGSSPTQAMTQMRELLKPLIHESALKYKPDADPFVPTE